MPEYWICFVSVGDTHDAAAVLTEHRATGGDRQTAGGEQQTQEELLTHCYAYMCQTSINCHRVTCACHRHAVHQMQELFNGAESECAHMPTLVTGICELE